MNIFIPSETNQRKKTNTIDAIKSAAALDVADLSHYIASCHKVKVDGQWYEWDVLVNSKDFGYGKEKKLYVGYKNPAPNQMHYERIIVAKFKTGKI